MFKPFPLHAADFYKTGHIRQYPENTQLVYSNFTPRSTKHLKLPDVFFDGKVVFFGLQGTMRELHDLWKTEFFDKPTSEVVNKFKRRMDAALGEGAVDVSHIEALHSLGYLPIRVKALPEGSRVNPNVPVFTVVSTDPRFYWITNYLETMLSAESWKASTSATVAYAYRQILLSYAEKTGAPIDFVAWQGHDFSMRGMSGIHDASRSGAAHLLSFLGTDTICAIDYLEDYYGAASTFVGGSVPATEHSVMCMGGKEDEIQTFRRLISEIYPSGIVSIVSDTWDFWQVVTEFAATLKSEILARTPDALGNAKVVFRPDSGDPVDILCGTAMGIPELAWSAKIADAYRRKLDDRDLTPLVVAHEGKYYEVALSEEKPTFVEVQPTPEMKGAVQCLWDTFGGTLTDKGYKVLNQRVGLIYGDSITPDRAVQIMQRLADRGFASCNTVLGIGSFTYQYSTRDTLGFAMKATFGVVDGEEREIFKEPKTDSGKRSARGLLRVQKVNGELVLQDRQDWIGEGGGMLEPIYEDGNFLRFEDLDLIRRRLW